MASILLALSLSSPASKLRAQEEQAKDELMAAVSSSEMQAHRVGTTLRLELGEGVGSEVTIPRLAAPLKSLGWSDSQPDAIKLIPQQDRWTIRWQRSNSTGRELHLEFGTEPRLLSELRPIEAQADGSFWFPGHRAETVGTKIRYEPQSFKNTIGYWTGKDDYASWEFSLQQAGLFNIAILQGCGQGQGGSTASISVVGVSAGLYRAELKFRVAETGHFQNFHWRHLGEIELRSPGLHRLTIRPLEIAQAALMDVRAVHLIRLPSSN